MDNPARQEWTSAAEGDEARRSLPGEGPPADLRPRSRYERESYYQRFQPLIRGLIKRYGTETDIREELIGELYCRYNALLDKFDESRGVPLSAYIIRNLSTAAYTFARSRWRRGRRETDSEAAIIAAVDPAQGPQEVVLGSDRVDPDFLAALPAALGNLPPRQREVVNLRYFDGWSFEEIGYALSIKPATCRSLLRHALNNLRSRYGLTRD